MVDMRDNGKIPNSRKFSHKIFDQFEEATRAVAAG
jgi:hypothetical protein